MTYDVHVYAIVRVTRSSVEASSPAAAVERVIATTDLCALFDSARVDNKDVRMAFTDDVQDYVVDAKHGKHVSRSWTIRHDDSDGYRVAPGIQLDRVSDSASTIPEARR